MYGSAHVGVCCFDSIPRQNRDRQRRGTGGLIGGCWPLQARQHPLSDWVPRNSAIPAAPSSTSGSTIVIAIAVSGSAPVACARLRDASSTTIWSLYTDVCRAGDVYGTRIGMIGGLRGCNGPSLAA